MSPLEVVAVGFAIAYLLLAIRQNIWCWAAALLSTGLYVVVMYRVALYMESALQFFYIGMAVYGWYNWSAGKTAAGLLPVTTWPASRHALAIAGPVVGQRRFTDPFQRGCASLSGLFHNLGCDRDNLDGRTKGS